MSFKFSYEHPMFKYWPMKNYEAITLPWGIYFKHSLIETDKVVKEHELIHYQQIKKHGAIWFYTQYISEYIYGLIKFRNHNKAYMNISFEKEAYGRSKRINQ